MTVAGAGGCRRRLRIRGHGDQRDSLAPGPTPHGCHTHACRRRRKRCAVGHCGTLPRSRVRRRCGLYSAGAPWRERRRWLRVRRASCGHRGSEGAASLLHLASALVARRRRSPAARRRRRRRHRGRGFARRATSRSVTCSAALGCCSLSLHTQLAGELLVASASEQAARSGRRAQPYQS